ncbi:MAG: hypothetical protein V7784_03075 [Oceanospirillaceae bacterium]
MHKRWIKEQMHKILESRLETIREFISYFKQLTHKPALFISSPAIGYYGIETTAAMISKNSLTDESFSSVLVSNGSSQRCKLKL